MKKYTIQYILFKTFEAEDEEDACYQADNSDWSRFDMDKGSGRIYEGEYDFNTYQKEALEDE